VHSGWLVEYWYVIFCVGVTTESAQFWWADNLNASPFIRHNDSIFQVERTVREVLPTVKEHRKNVRINYVRCFWYSKHHSSLFNRLLVPLLAYHNVILHLYHYQLDTFVQDLKDKLDSTQKEAAAWKAKYNIKTQEEMDASSRQ
jgi:hypothetical protein